MKNWRRLIIVIIAINFCTVMSVSIVSIAEVMAAPLSEHTPPLQWHDLPDGVQQASTLGYRITAHPTQIGITLTINNDDFEVQRWSDGSYYQTLFYYQTFESLDDLVYALIENIGITWHPIKSNQDS